MKGYAITLKGFGYSAEIRTFGSKLAKLAYQGRHLIETFNEADFRNLFVGDILAPWPNRLAEGKYSVHGTNYFVPVNEVFRNNALHGLIYGREWECIRETDTSCTLKYLLHESQAYGFTIEFNSIFQIDEFGLTWKISAKNLSIQSALYGISIHPYLVADDNTPVDVWELQLPARQYLEVDNLRLLPKGIYECSYRDFDFMRPKIIGDLQIDHAFLIDKDFEEQSVKLIAPSGKGVRMTFGSEAKWIQIHTADREGALDARRSLAVEPMTCPPDAFNHKQDLIWLSNGESHEATWNFQAIVG